MNKNKKKSTFNFDILYAVPFLQAIIFAINGYLNYCGILLGIGVIMLGVRSYLKHK